MALALCNSLLRVKHLFKLSAHTTTMMKSPTFFWHMGRISTHKIHMDAPPCPFAVTILQVELHVYCLKMVQTSTSQTVMVGIRGTGLLKMALPRLCTRISSLAAISRR